MIRLFLPDAGKTFSRAMRGYAAATKKDEIEILNNEGLNVARETLRRIPKAESANIKAQLGTPKKPSRLAIRLAVKSLGPGKSKRAYMDKAAKIVTARLRSIAYIKAGQIPIIKAFGGKGKDPSAKSWAAKSTGKKARRTEALPTAILTNRSTGAGKVGASAAEEALKVRAARLNQSAWRRLQSTARKFSGK